MKGLQIKVSFACTMSISKVMLEPELKYLSINVFKIQQHNALNFKRKKVTEIKLRLNHNVL